MCRRSILSIVICIVAVHEIFADLRQAKSSIFQINHKKPIHAVSDKFLSFTVDPTTLLHVADCELTNATLSLIKGLLPAYLRVAGTDSNRLLFKSSFDGKHSPDSSISTSSKSQNLVLSGNQWNQFHEFLSSTGLNLIVSLSGGIFNDKQTDRDLSNALEFITFSNKNNFNMNWQLGYELQKISRDDGKTTGQDVARLRKILEVFPRYQNSLIIGPDVTNFESRENILFLRNYLLYAQNALNVFTIHPNFTTIQDKDLYDSLSDLFTKMDTYLWLREGIFKTASKGVVPKKPIWIAESEDKESECKFVDSMSMIKRLGVAAKLGASVYLRKPHLLSIYEPTSEFWAASLFKALVGRSVLDTRLANGNNSSLVVFSHCTQILEKPEESLINPTIAYERGSITAYGVNSESEPVRLVFKTGIKSDETIHMYVLTEDSRNRIGKTLLNRQHLGLSNENDLPMVSPKIRESAESVVVPAHSIFFLVFPNIRCRACMQQLAEDNQEATKTKIRPSIPDDEESTNTAEGSVNIPENFDEPEDENAVYVSYPTKSERIKAAHKHLPEITQVAEVENPLREEGTEIGPKFFTFSEDTWLSSFPEKFKEIEQPTTDDVAQNSQSRKEKHSKIEKYRVLAQAIVGQRNVTAKQSTRGEESDTGKELEDSHRDFEGRTKRLMRTSRSVASVPSEINSLYQQTRDNSHHAFVPYDLPITEDLEESNNIPSDWLTNNRERRDIGGDDSVMLKSSPREVIKIVEELPDPSTSLPAVGESNLGSIADKINLPSTLPELVIESDDSINIRQNREIDGRSVVAQTNLASEPKIVADSNVATSLGPVSPFPRHHIKPTKTKSKSGKVKKTSKSIDSYQNESNESSSTEPNLEMFSKTSTEQSANTAVDSAASGDKKKNSEIPTETSPSTSLYSTSQLNVEDSENSNKNVPSTVPAARNADPPMKPEISPKHATHECIVSESVPHWLHSATHKNKATAHPAHSVHQTEAPVHPTDRTRTKGLKPKATPINPVNDFMKKLKDDANKLQPPLDPHQILDLAHARIQELLDIHKARMEERQRKIQEAAANKKQEGRNSNHGRNKRETIDSDPIEEPKNFLDQSDSDDDVVASSRQVHPQKDHAPNHLHGRTNVPSRTAPTHLHRSTEAPSRPVPTHLHESAEAPPRPAPTHLHGSAETPSRPAPTHLHGSAEAPLRPTHTHLHGNAETPSRPAPTHLHGSAEAPSRTAPNHLHRGTEAPSRVVPNHLHRSTETPSRISPLPRREKPARKQLQVSEKNTHDLRHMTTKSPLADQHKARLHLHESKQDRHQLQKRDVFEDFFSKARDIYEDVSTNVQKNLAPVEKWVEEKAEDVKHELRIKRDLEALKEKFRERKEKLRQKFEDFRQHHRIHVRDVGSHHQGPRPAHHFDEQIKDYKKHMHHAADPERKMKQNHKISGEHKIVTDKTPCFKEPISNRFVRSPVSNDLFGQDEQGNEIIFTENFDIVVSSDQVNKSSVDISEPRVFGNFSDILSPPEKKSTTDESQCNDTSFLTGILCQTMKLFSNLFSWA